MWEAVLRWLRRMRGEDRSAEFEGMAAHIEQALAERDAALAAEQTTREALERALAERDAALAAEQTTREALERASAERDAALAAEQTTRQALERASAERDAALASEQRLRAERDAERTSRQKPEPRPTARAANSSSELRDRFRLWPVGSATGEANAVVVPVHGPAASREIAITQPFLEDYCRSIGADLRVVELPESVPGLRTKASLLPVARQYRRIALIDPDVIVRAQCPDLFSLVPDDRVGAVREGAWVDRREACAELARLYGADRPLPAEHYIDTGVLVVSAPLFMLFESLLDSRPMPHPRGEQGLINAIINRDGVPLHPLPRAFNWIPYTPDASDWRWSWIFHMAGYWRSPPNHTAAWQRSVAGDQETFAPAPLSPEHCRLPCLMEIAGQLRGEDVRVFHPADLGYHPPVGRLLLADEAALVWCQAGGRADFAGLRDSPPIYGPYARLPAGRWRVSLLGPDCREPADEATIVDVVCDSGKTTLRDPAEIGPGASVEIALGRDVADTEVRIYRGARDVAVGAIVFKRLD